MTEWFIIPDLQIFTDRARAIVYHNFGVWNKDSEIDILIDDIADNEKDDLDKILSHQESLVIVKQNLKKQKNKKTNLFRYLVNEKLFATIVEDLNARMVSNIINTLVTKGLVESAFDEKSNDFIFWIKDDANQTEKPETD